MTSEADTFNALRRIPFKEMMRVVSAEYMNAPKNAGCKKYLYSKRPGAAAKRERFFEEHMWTVNDFIAEMKESNYAFLLS